MKKNDNYPLIKQSAAPSSASLLFSHGVSGVDRFYNYCPSVFEEDGVRHIYYCANKDAGDVTDYIAYRRGEFVEGAWTYSATSYVLSPTASAWDSRHTCDPSVVKGSFRYNGVTYPYLMNYLACDQDDSMGNETGFAVSNAPEGPWIKCNAINPFIPFNEDLDVWGNGQVCMINIDGAGRILYFYSYGGKIGTFEVVREYDLSNLNSPVLIRSCNLSMAGQIAGDIGNNDAEFAYDVANKKLIMVKSKHPYNRDSLSPTFISDSLILYVLDLSGNANPIDEVFKGSGQKAWSYLTTIDSNVSGFPRNHNPGLVTDPYGKVLSSNSIEVNFAVSGLSDDFWSFISTYRIYRSTVELNYGKFSGERLNKGAHVVMKSSGSSSDLSTLRINLGNNMNIADNGIYLRMRNYKSIETPIALTFENASGYSCKATPSQPFYTYDVNGNNFQTRHFRSFGSYLLLPSQFDGFIYIPFSSMTTEENGTRNLATLKYIYFSLAPYYDGYANFALGDVVGEFLTHLDVSSLSAASFNSKFLVLTGSSYMALSQLPANDFLSSGKDLLGGIHVTMNRDNAVDRNAQWILRSQNSDLSGEGLYFRMKNNTANPYYIVFYLLATNNHRMQLNQNSPIYYYDTNGTNKTLINSRDFSTYFYLPASFDGFIFIPYSSLLDESSWGGNQGTTMRYDSIAHVYFGASAFYDYSLDFIVGDVFTANAYLYDGSLSKYNEFSLHAERVWESDYVNISYAPGYRSEATCYAEDFLSATYPCSSAAQGAWAGQAEAFFSLSSSAQSELVNASYAGKNYNDCTAIEQFAWRYDLAVNNLGLNNFMSRASQLKINHKQVDINQNIVIALLSLGVLSTLGVLYLKKKRMVL